MNQQTLARMLRIQCVDRVCDIDLPGFLIDTIESSLALVNSYKLTNLLENIDAVHLELLHLGEQYSYEVSQLTQEHEPLNRHRNILQYLTSTLLQEKKSTKITISKMEAVRLKNVYTITCLMMLKEHMNRNTRIQVPNPHHYSIRMESSSLEVLDS